MNNYDYYLMNEDFDLGDTKESYKYREVKKHSLIDFIINEKADPIKIALLLFCAAFRRAFFVVK